MRATLRLPFLAAAATMTVACAKEPERVVTETPPPPQVVQPAVKEPEQIVNIGVASFDKFSEDSDSLKIWTVRWKSAVATIYEEGDFAGTMLEVTGSIYQGKEEVSTFSADEGTAIKASELLTLSGNVTITAKESGVTMTCQKIVYEAKKKLIRASGNIRIEGKLGVISGVREIWTTPMLTTVATPDLWETAP